MKNNPQLLYILGSGHCGSTLLDILLNSHPDFTGLGEFHNLKYRAKGDHICSCAATVNQCEFWTSVKIKVAERLNVQDPFLHLDVMLQAANQSKIQNYLEKAALIKLPSTPFLSLAKKLFPYQLNAIQNSAQIYSAISETANTRYVVDGTKDVRRMLWLHKFFRNDFKVIHLIRDGRAVSASEMRREEVPMKIAAKNWLRYTKKARIALKSVPSDQQIDIKYEELCSKTKDSLQIITKFLGVDQFKTTKLNKADSHALHGNKMRWRRDETEIVLDEKWRRELNTDDLATFEETAGKINNRIGYSST